MKIFILFVFLAMCQNAIASDFKLPVGARFNPNRVTSAPISVDYFCKLELHEYLNGWKLILDREFAGNVGQTTNYKEFGIEIRGANYAFTYVYNKMSTSAFANDPFDGENSSIHLERKTQTGSDPLIEASVSSRDFQELPTYYDLREDFKAEGSQFIMRVSCRTVKNF